MFSQAASWRTYLASNCLNCIYMISSAHCGPETHKRVPCQTVKTLMKCCKMQHFIRVCTVWKDKNDQKRKRYNIILEIITCDPLKIYNGPSRRNCIKLYGKFHWYTTG